MSVTSLFSDFLLEDLAKSGLEVRDLNARPLTSTERHATGSPQGPEGYVIPYYDIYGKALPFYRVRLQNWDPKYKQVSDAPNHLYFPRGFWERANSEECPFIVFTEGEKKAACAFKLGFAAVGCGGVDSWSNKTVSIPGDAKLTKGKDGSFVAKLTAGSEAVAGQDSLAEGMQKLIDLVIRRDIPLIIIYDSDERGRVASQVQAAAARLGYALRFHGIAARNIKQFVITPPKGYTEESIGLDDLLCRTQVGRDQLHAALLALVSKAAGFPKHPNPRDYINKRLKASRLSREKLQALATAVLCDLDANGSRLYSPDEDELYYFAKGSKKLMRVSFKLTDGYAKTDWGVFLYQTYNLSAADERVLVWLETLFAGEQPITEVQPERVLAVREDAIYYQISSAQMIKVSAKEIRVLDNGSDDILFLSDSVEDLDKGILVKGVEKLLALEGPLPNYWLAVTKKARLADDAERSQAKLLSYLYSISPWFYRWRGTQLPVEMVVGEPGSGKSTLYQLRLNILNGRPRLRNPAKDITDWSVSVGSAGGIHVTDNINMINGQLRQMISDEMCRLVTEPAPMIEKRKLYTDNDMVFIPVKTVFAVTSVRQPFNAPDIIQRSIITYMDKGDEAVDYEGDWADQQLMTYGGREGWMALQLVFIHRLLQKVVTSWDNRYRAKIRLINIEQLMRFTAQLYGESDEGLVEYMEATQAEKIAEGDLMLGALRRFSELVVEKHGENNKSKRFTAKDIAKWASDQEDFRDIEVLTNARRLGKFLKQSTNLLATVSGISEWGDISNATAYIAHQPKK